MNFDDPSQPQDETLEVLVNVTNASADCGLRVADRDRVSVAYDAFADRTLIDRASEAAPLLVPMGYDQLIPGFELSLLNLCAGQTASFTLPSELAFGQHAPFSIPRGASLRYDVTVLRIFPSPLERVGEPLDLWRHIDSNADGQLSREEVKRHFRYLGKDVPPSVWSEDVDGDGLISRDEFGGPKGAPAVLQKALDDGAETIEVAGGAAAVAQDQVQLQEEEHDQVEQQLDVVVDRERTDGDAGAPGT